MYNCIDICSQKYFTGVFSLLFLSLVLVLPFPFLLLIDAFTHVNICVNKCSFFFFFFFACMCVLLMLMPCLYVHTHKHTHTHVRILVNCHQSISNAHILFDLLLSFGGLFFSVVTMDNVRHIYSRFILLSYCRNVTQNNKNRIRLNRSEREQKKQNKM